MSVTRVALLEESSPKSSVDVPAPLTGNADNAAISRDGSR